LAGHAEVKGYVLDASVVVKWFSGRGEADLDKALKLREEILEGSCSVYVPDLLFYELSNVLRYHPGSAPEDVGEAVASLFDMGFQPRRPAEESLFRAVELGFEHNVTVYDAAYLALAEIEDCTLVTADLKFYERVKGVERVIRLSDAE